MTKQETLQKPPKAGSAKVPDHEHTLTVKEVAELDRCSEKTVRRAIAAGLLEATRIGPGQRLLRITREAHAHYRHTKCD